MRHLAACAALLLALGAPAAARGSSPLDVAFAAEASRSLAETEVERIRLGEEISFLKDRIESEHREDVLLLLDDDGVLAALIERAEARLADARVGTQYLEQHPRRVGSRARVAAVEGALEQLAWTALEGREMHAAVLDAQAAALTAALAERSLSADPRALEVALVGALVEVEVERIGLQVEVDRYRELREQGQLSQLRLLLPPRVAAPTHHLTRELNAAHLDEARHSIAYGDEHPSRVDARQSVQLIEDALGESMARAVGAEVTRLKLLWAEQQALQRRLDEVADGD